MRSLFLLTALIVIIGCKTEKKINQTGIDLPQRGELSRDSQIFLGNRLFSEKKCITCHSVNQFKKGPSVKEIVAVYKRKDGDMLAFLTGDAPPIVPATPEEEATMKENIDGFLKELTPEMLQALVTYIYHVDTLNP